MRRFAASLMVIASAATLALGADTLPLNQQQARTSPEWMTRGVMYQIQPRAFTPEGTLQAAEARLPQLAELGVSVLYLCPVFVADDDMDQAGWSPRQKKSGMNNPRNPYRMKDYYHVDPEYGDDEDLKAFIRRAHQLKLRVLLDMVYLHCGPQAVFLADHPEFVQRDAAGKMVLKAWNFPGLDFANPELREYLWKNMEYWVREFGADGFRCDVSDGVPLDFWETARQRLERIRPDVGMLAEGTRNADQLMAFDLDYGWGFSWDDAAAVRKRWETMRAERPRGGAKFIRFIDNHDIANDSYDNRVEKQWGAARVDAALVVLFTLDGVPLLYNGQEVADTARHSIFGRLPINWDSAKTAAGQARFAFCQKLCALRHAERALTQGEVVWLENDAPNAVLSYLRTAGAEKILTVVNLSGKPVTVTLPALREKVEPLLADGAQSDAQGSYVLAAYGYFVGRSPGTAEPRCPLIPMGAITGKPDEQAVKRTLEAYRAVGIDQYLIYPRSGLELEYMGPEWLQVCEWFCKHARRLDMSIWLYDEYNWPSGSCKGRVPAENPDFESRDFAVFRDAGGAYTWKVLHSPGWVDNYNFPAMDRFIELTHKRYEQRLGDYLGSTVAGIFTDEPAHPVPVRSAGKPALVFRYFDGAEAEYQAATGRELRADVQAYLEDNSRDEVWTVYYRLLGERFRKAYFDPIRAWCDRVGILATGHLIAENSTADSSRYNGRPLHALKGLTLPGMDEIGTRYDPASIEWLTLAVAQHAIGRRGNGGLAELFALGPSDMSHATQRQMIWLCALHKVDRYVLAVAPLDARGNVEKNGYFNPLTPMQPWFAAFRLLGEESRIAARYAAKPTHCDIAIRYPQGEAARLAARRHSHPALLAALRRFSARQLTYDLYEEDEPCDKPLIFSFAGTTMKEENSGREFSSPDEAAEYVKEVCPPKVWVETAAGAASEEVLVRHYEDDTVVVLGLTAKEHGALRLMRRGGEPVPFELPARGVFRLEGKAAAVAAPRDVRPLPADTSLEIALDSVNRLRLAPDAQGAARITVGHPLSAARLVLRSHPVPCVVTLDGRPVTADLPCDALRPGLNELYRQTAPFRLEAGEHVLQVEAGGNDTIYFLPIAWLTGDFAVECGALSEVPKTAGVGALWKWGLADFAGAITYTAEVQIPAHAGRVRLRINTGGLYSSVSLDGKALGERAWAPFEWDVPDDVRGKTAELSITVWTSVAPMFGDWRNPDAAWSKTFWVPPPDHLAEIGLLAPPEWLLF